MESILDAEMPDQVIWPAQVVCGGLAWTRNILPEERKVTSSTALQAGYNRLG